ncbi:speckle-type POZ protein homolog [Paramacrobiotus metropolitanus]|uniref:speckle-type POZ protein homolog n=1 Tax=Paramacrobiotus metropolitanus TaxID=2943436 RepID=UPI00244594FD|nr:speckle-type POZ protein homolog [Paramacrobiotus metropolitanus]
MCLTDTELSSRVYTGNHAVAAAYTIRATTGDTTENVLRAWDGIFRPVPLWASSTESNYEWIILFALDGRSQSWKKPDAQDTYVTLKIDATLYEEPKSIRENLTLPRAPDTLQLASNVLYRQMDGSRNVQHKQTGDFILRSKKGTEFPAHRFILMSQSPVFAAMLTHDTKEKQESRCDLGDIDAECVEILLEYIYGSETGKVTAENAVKVLSMADQYALMDLRAVCEHTLADSISVEKAFLLLTFSAQRGLPVLRAAAMALMPKYLDNVLHGKGLEEIMQSDPELVQRVVEYCAKKVPGIVNLSCQ